MRSPAAINENTCAILIEPIQGEGGVNVPPEGFLKRAWGLCSEHRVLFMADEIQTGLGRTGHLFACDHEDVKPDVLIVGKALAAGFYPVSAVLASRDLMMLFRPGDHGSTFGGNPLGSAVALAALEVIVQGKVFLPAHATRGEDHAGSARDFVAAHRRGARARIADRRAVFGSGAAVSEELLKRGIAAKDTHENVLRIAPPLVIEDEHIDLLLGVFGESIATL